MPCACVDPLQISLIYGSLTVDDILLKKELDALVAMHGNRLSVYHVLNTPPMVGWDGGSGFITRDIISTRFTSPGGAFAHMAACMQACGQMGATPFLTVCF